MGTLGIVKMYVLHQHWVGIVGVRSMMTLGTVSSASKGRNSIIFYVFDIFHYSNIGD